MPDRHNRQVLAVIAARGGSRALPGKNLATLAGKPLIAWTIEAAMGSRVVSRTVVTTDDPSIAEAAAARGAEVPFLRPAHLAGDETPGTDAILHAVEWLVEHHGYRPDIVVNLQPTSPLRTAADIDAAIQLMDERDADSVVSVAPAEPHPYWAKRIDERGWMTNLIDTPQATSRRQELPPAFMLNGAIYAAKFDVLARTRGWYTERTAAYVMPAERSVDIDTAIDLLLARALVDHDHDR